MKHNIVNDLLLTLLLVIRLDYSAAESSDDDSFDIDSSDQQAYLETTIRPTIKTTRGPFSYCNVLQFVNRSSWEAELPDYEFPMMVPVDKIFIDYTYSERCSSLYLCSFNLKLTQEYHKKQIGLFDIGYNFMIGDDSKVYIGRDFMVARAFDDDYNNNSLLIGIIGDYENPYGPLPRSLDIIYKLIRCGQEKGIITDNITIYEPVPDYCQKGPGKKLYNFMILNRLRPASYRCLNSYRKFSPEILRDGFNILKYNKYTENYLNNRL